MRSWRKSSRLRYWRSRSVGQPMSAPAVTHFQYRGGIAVGELVLPVGHRVGRVTMETDPVTGELVEVVVVDTGGGGGGAGKVDKAVTVRQRDPGHGYAYVSMEALWFLCLYLRNHAAMVLALEAARRHKLGMEPLALTYAMQKRLGLSQRGTRTALDALASAEAALGWFRVSRSGNRAVTVEATELGFQHLWASPTGKKG